MVTNKTIVFRKIPTGVPVDGEHLVLEEQQIDLENVPSGGLIVEILSASLDPYQRGRMRDAHVKSYFPAFTLNETIDNFAVARVLKSDSDKFAPGDLIYSFLPFAQYAAIPAEKLGVADPMFAVQKLNNPYNLPTEVFLGPLGLAGLTAYSSIYEIGKPKKGETIWVSSAAGAVGQMVGHICKREGLRVIGSVGSDEKLDFILNEIGFDVGFNYKKEKPMDALARLAPEGLDIYYENVGGDHMEAALEHMKDHGRIVVSGVIEGYNQPMEERYGVRNLLEMFAKKLTMTGFLVSDPPFGPAYFEEHQKNVQQWIHEKLFNPKLHITHGIEHGAEALLELYEGKNFGKAVLKIKED